ncbi:MAG: protein jag [bacterium]|nr:hypothetical protein [candidate division WOR-3 bacterium]MDH5684381.1 hypothetical protein [candidate division WOR-3 bacterium]
MAETATTDQTGDQIASAIEDVLRSLLNFIGVRAKLDVKNTELGYYANIKTRYSNGLLIGYRGFTLRSIQYLTRLIVQRKHPEVPGLMVDVSGYRMRRQNFLCKKATAIARIVLETNREMALDQLSDREREVVEKALSPFTDVKVYAVGSGYRKNIIVAPVKLLGHN